MEGMNEGRKELGMKCWMDGRKKGIMKGWKKGKIMEKKRGRMRG